ncbi:MAG: DUF3727 domain-containing protein [Cyanobacteriota bacterium]|nr:DUF3727 domain-containing protein [Cyanobacteriota bacterium]
MPPDDASMTGSGDVPTLLVNDSQGRQLLCYLEQLVPLDGIDYALLTPVDTPVNLVRLPRSDDDEPEEIVDWDERVPILAVAEAVLQEHNLTLVRSAATLTVTGDFEDADFDEEDDEEDLEEEENSPEDEDEGEAGELYESLLDRPFYVGEDQYDLFVPLDPFFVVARVAGSAATLVEGDEFASIQPRLEAELEERDLEV